MAGGEAPEKGEEDKRRQVSGVRENDEDREKAPEEDAGRSWTKASHPRTYSTPSTPRETLQGTVWNVRSLQSSGLRKQVEKRKHQKYVSRSREDV